MLFVAVRREYGQAVETTEGLICPVKMSVMSAKVEGRVCGKGGRTNALTVSPAVVVET
jgi:hypothetical protein